MTMMSTTGSLHQRKSVRQQSSTSGCRSSPSSCNRLGLSLLLLLYLVVVVVHGSTEAEQQRRRLQPRNCHGVPHHVHLSVGADPATSMTVTFATTPSYETAPVAGVAIGVTPNDFEYIVVERESSSHYHVPTFDDADAKGPPTPKSGQSLYWSDHYHHINITNLQPDTVYYYQPVVAASRQELKIPNTHNNLRSSSNTKNDPPSQETSQLAPPHTHYNPLDNVYDKPQAQAQVNGAAMILNHQGERRRFLANYDTTQQPCPAVDRPRWFRTAPASSSNNTVIPTTTLAVLGDLGQTPHSATNLQDLYETTPQLNFALLVGDIAYVDKAENKWDVFFDFWDDMALPERIPVCFFCDFAFLSLSTVNLL